MVLIYEGIHQFMDWFMGITIFLMIFYLIRLLFCMMGKLSDDKSPKGFDDLKTMFKRKAEDQADKKQKDEEEKKKDKKEEEDKEEKDVPPTPVPPLPPPPVPPPTPRGKASVYGIIINKKTKGAIQSQIILTARGSLVADLIFKGKYVYKVLPAGPYQLVSQPSTKAYDTLTKTVVLEAGKSTQIDFEHTKPDRPPVKKDELTLLFEAARKLRETGLFLNDGKNSDAAKSLKKAKYYVNKAAKADGLEKYYKDTPHESDAAKIKLQIQGIKVELHRKPAVASNTSLFADTQLSIGLIMDDLANLIKKVSRL